MPLDASAAPTRGPTGPRCTDRVPTFRMLGDAVRDARTAKGLTRVAVAELAGVDYSQIKAIEKCVGRSIARPTLQAVMDVLGMEGIPQKAPPPPLRLWWVPPKGKVMLRTLDCRNLRRLRLNRNVTQVALARAVGTNTATCQWLEYDKQRTHTDAVLLARVATVLEIRPHTFLGRSLRSLGFSWTGDGVGLNIEWDTLELGQKSDCEIAEEAGLQVRTVERERNRRGIPAYTGPRRPRPPQLPPWTAEQLRDVLGEAPRKSDGQIDWLRVPLGCTTDKEIVRWVGGDASTVVYHRKRFGIPRYSHVLWDAVPFGDVPDTVIAVWVGRTTTLVSMQRKKRGIAAAPRECRRDAAGAIYKMELDPSMLTPRELRFPVS